MKRKIITLLSAVLAVAMMGSVLAPVLFAETVYRIPFLPDIPPLALRIVMIVALASIVLLVAARIVLSLTKRK